MPNTTPKPPLLLFTLTNLVIGTGAFMLAGILAGISADLGVSIASAGQAMTAYALSTAIFAPLMLVLTGRLHSKHAMALALGIFALGNLVCALAVNLPMLLGGRVLMGMGAMFTPIAAGMAVAGSAPDQRGKALSMVFLGISLSYVIGMPLGNWLAAQATWRLPVQCIVVCALIALLALLWRVPANLRAPAASFTGVGALLKQREVMSVLALTVLYFAAIFNVFAYIGPVLQALNTLTVGEVSSTLMLFGLSGVAGTLIGGAATDRFGPVRALKVQLSIFTIAQLLLPLTAGHYGWTLVTLLAWGTAGFGMMPAQQIRLVNIAPAHAPMLMSLHASMLYLGTALGAAFGGAVSHWLGFAHQSWAGVPLALAALGTLWVAAKRK
jgi:MFS transporter, DHA1 family, inner membrane transport protein